MLKAQFNNADDYGKYLDEFIVRLNYIYQCAAIGKNHSIVGMSTKIRLSIPELPSNVLGFMNFVGEVSLDFGFPTRLSGVFIDRGYDVVPCHGARGAIQGYKICFEDVTGTASTMVEGARYEALQPLLKKWDVYCLEAGDSVIVTSASSPIRSIVPVHR